jgi:multiple sugar transport system substrate-binding protein
MTMHETTRRRFVAGMAAVPAMPLALGSLSRAALAETRLRLFWWGNPERDKRTFQVVDVYKKKNPDVQVDAEAIGWTDYWPKMATQAAGRNMADVVQMDYRYLYEYARRNQLEPLDEYVGEELDLSRFDPTFLDSGRFQGKLYAVPWTVNSTACYYDTVRLNEFGVTMPDWRWTWDDLKTVARDIKKQAPEGYAAVANKGIWEPMLEFFLRQRGKALYTEDGEIASTQEDVTDYFGLWDSLRQEGLVPAADVTTRDIGGLDALPLTGRKCAIDFAHSNQIIGLQALVPNELGVTMLPNLAGGRPGQYLKPSMLISMSRTSPNKDGAVKLLAFLAYDLDAAAVLGVERGVPGDKQAREFLLDKVNPVERKMIDYLDIVAGNVSPLPPPPPKGAGEVETLLRRFYPELAFGRMDVKDGSERFFKQTQAVLRRA